MSDLEYEGYWADDEDASKPLQLPNGLTSVHPGQWIPGSPWIRGIPESSSPPKQCECGAHKTSFPDHHSAWCPMFKDNRNA